MHYVPSAETKASWAFTRVSERPCSYVPFFVPFCICFSLLSLDGINCISEFAGSGSQHRDQFFCLWDVENLLANEQVIILISYWLITTSCLEFYVLFACSLLILLAFPVFSTLKLTSIFFLHAHRPQDSNTLVSLACGSLSGVASSTGKSVFPCVCVLYVVQIQASCLNHLPNCWIYTLLWPVKISTTIQSQKKKKPLGFFRILQSNSLFCTQVEWFNFSC